MNIGRTPFIEMERSEIEMSTAGRKADALHRDEAKRNRDEHGGRSADALHRDKAKRNRDEHGRKKCGRPTSR